jgi:hypothetical protein
VERSETHCPVCALACRMLGACGADEAEEGDDSLGSLGRLERELDCREVCLSDRRVSTGMDTLLVVGFQGVSTGIDTP